MASNKKKRGCDAAGRPFSFPVTAYVLVSMKEKLFNYTKVEGGWRVCRNGNVLGVVLSIAPIKGHPWAKFLPAGDASNFGNWYEHRDDAAFELLMRKKARRSASAERAA